MKADQKLLGVMRRAIADHKMIEDGDRIAVGLSGGKDSLVLLSLLAAYRRFAPESFSLMAITVDLGFKGADFGAITDYCARLDVPYHIEHTQIAEIIFDIRKETSPCSLCSKMRRGTLNTVIIEKGYNKLALGHHGDDLIETFFLSMLYEGRLSTFSPVNLMDRTNITLIRPLIYAGEGHIRAASRDLPVLKNPCPADHHTRREDMKSLIATIAEANPAARDNIFRALTNPNRDKLWKKT